MAACTPDWKAESELKPLSSRYVKMDQLSWRKTSFPGVEIKMLLEDKETGLMTSITRMAPGAVLPLHEHVGVEQTYVLEGRLVDERGRGEGRGICLAARRQPARGNRARGRVAAGHVPPAQQVPLIESATAP